MDSGYYAAMTGLLARMQALDTAAENLANAQTPGFRAERDYFRGVMLDEAGMGSQLGQTVNNYGLLGGDQLSMGQGPLQATGNPLDLAIEGQGFFAIQTQEWGALYPRREFSSLADGDAGDGRGRAGALRWRASRCRCRRARSP